MSVGVAIALGAVLGLRSASPSASPPWPFAPEAGLVLGALAGWLVRQKRA